MSQVLRFNSTDPRVSYGGQWSTNWRQNGTSSSATSGAQFFLLFRGTNVKVYGGSVGDVNWIMAVDGRDHPSLSQGTLADIRPSPIFSSGGLDDGDHQLFVRIPSFPANGLIFLDYFEIENSSGRGFNLLSTGPTSPDVPAQAVTVDNTNSGIILNNTSQWTLEGDIGCYQGSKWWTTVTGASLSYSFDGIAIWYYARNGPDLAVFTVSIDDSTPQSVNATSKLGVNQSMLWSNTSLVAGRHTVTLTHDGANGSWFALDFFRVLRQEDASALQSTTFTAIPTNAPTVGSISETSRVPLAVGLTLGLLAIGTIVLGGVYYLHRRRRRRRRAPIDLDPCSISSPYTVPPMAQADQRPRLLQIGKHRPQSTGPSGASVATTNLEIESGPPPSYEAS